MKITISSTDRIVTINGEPVRIWEGETAKGVPVVAFVRTIAIRSNADNSEAEADLQEHDPPSPAAAIWSPRMVL